MAVMAVTVGSGWAVVVDQGARTYMEDRYIVEESLGRDALLFGVFDGHNGHRVADHCRANFARHIRRELSDVSKPVGRALEAAVESLDAETRLPGLMDVGSTACMVVVTESDVWFVNVGDSRALMKSGGTIGQVTVDHKPAVRSESDRVRRLGGSITNTDGSWRINGRLNLSRSVGDWSMRPFIVSAPTIEHRRRRSDGREEYVVIGSDGLFDVMSNADVGARIDANPHTKGGISNALRSLVSESRSRGSTDNITVVYLGLFVPSCHARSR